MPGTTDRPPLVVGVDLGNAGCRLAAWRGDDLEPVLMDAGGTPSFPAVVARDARADTWLFGRSALEAAGDPSLALFTDLKASILNGSGPTAGEEVARRLLKKLKLGFQSDCASRIVNAVVTVPYGYSVAQRAALRRTVEGVPLPVAALLNEPEAAVLAYRLDQKIRDRAEHVLVFDAGATHCTVSVLRVSMMGAYLDIELLSEAAVLHAGVPVGGRTIDDRLVQACLSGRLQVALPPTEDGPAGDPGLRTVDCRLWTALRDARHQLGSAAAVEFPLPWDDQQTGKLTREDLEQWADFDDAMWAAIRSALQGSRSREAPDGLEQSRVDRVLLVGGLNRSPQVARAVSSFDRIEPREEGFEECALAVGAARCASILSGRCDDVVFTPKETPAFGVRTGPDAFDKVIPENAPVGFEGEKVYTLPMQSSHFMALQVCQGFAKRFTPEMSLGWERVELRFPDGKRPGDPVERKLHVRMTLLEGEVAVEVNDRTEGLPAASPERFRFAVR